MVPAQPEPFAATGPTTASNEDIAIFDRVKKYLNNKQTYNEFLKLLNLFSQDMINKSVLINRLENFIGGNPELIGWFKKYIGLETVDPTMIENVPATTSKVRLNTCRALGPSYRLLPKMVCSLHN